MHLRIYWKQAGEHVHCRVYIGQKKTTDHGKAGDLTFTRVEWFGEGVTGGVWDAFNNIAEVRADSVAPIREVADAAAKLE